MNIRRQKPVKGGRSRLSTGVMDKADRWVNREAHRFNVSRSFVIAVAIAQVAGISEQELYYTPAERSAKVVPIRKRRAG